MKLRILLAAIPLLVLLALVPTVHQNTGMPACESTAARRAERIQGAVERGRTFTRVTPSGWILRLEPNPEGFSLRLAMKGREADNLAGLTPPWHFVPNPLEIEGWHFRNADNTGPNDGTVNAPQELREFVFSPEVGRTIEYRGSGTSAEDVARVESFGRGWLFIRSYRLTPARKGERAAFTSLKFTACLTWPAQ